jgi:hypothetical protein
VCVNHGQGVGKSEGKLAVGSWQLLARKEALQPKTRPARPTSHFDRCCKHQEEQSCRCQFDTNQNTDV